MFNNSLIAQPLDLQLLQEAAMFNNSLIAQPLDLQLLQLLLLLRNDSRPVQRPLKRRRNRRRHCHGSALTVVQPLQIMIQCCAQRHAALT